MKKVLATSWHPGGINAIVPVIKNLREENRADVRVIGHEYSEPILQANEVNYKTIKDYNLSDVSVDSMDQLLQEESPDLVLTGTSGQDESNRDIIEHTIVTASKEREIPSISVLDLWVHYWQRFSDLYAGEKFHMENDKGKWKFLPDKIAIMDEYAKKDMLAEGFPEEKLVITGNPHFDDLGKLVYRYSKDMRKEIRRELCVSPNQFLIMYATDIQKDALEAYGFTDFESIEALCRGIKNAEASGRSDLILLLKKHPRETNENFENLISHAASYNVTVVTSDHDTRRTCLASELTVAIASTVTVEATLMDKDAVSLQANLEKPVPLITNRLNITPHAYTIEEGSKLIEDIILHPEHFDEYRERRKEFKVDGKATERVTNLVYNMLGLDKV